ncbi:CoA-binding protein [Ostreibacterium oceani]|uniref:CoA-binding protein n=1 Tax=Ostreibacterium oceani TaxID=2654998 RepID=A0A6N7EX36_9GAMM|nr:CoA-binding protein [Ostreibacterium oceani]MPV85979.1 CoA-binding protein [Ostreibacterium oceani]
MKTRDDLFSTSQTIAIVGLSDNPERDSYKVAQYMQNAGYRIIPVNPKLTHLLGETAYASLSDIPISVDIVNIFRRSDAVPPIVDEAIAIGAKTIWMQLGVSHESAADKAKAQGLSVIMDKCIKIEHAALES